jgi:3-hydroxybutyryl-CoA dehydrogenase
MRLPSSLPENVGVYGGGRMGAGIAHAFLVAGTSVTVVEVSEPAAAAARARAEASLAKAQERGKLAGPLPDIVARLSVSTDPGVLTRCELVVDAVPEDVELKRRVPDRKLLPSSTSSPSTTCLNGIGVGERPRMVPTFTM